MLRRMMFQTLNDNQAPSGLYMLTDWHLQNLDIVNGNSFRPNASDARAWSASYIPVGGVGEIRGCSHISIFGLDRDFVSDPWSALDYGVWRAPQGIASTVNNNDFVDGGEIPESALERVRCDGQYVYQEYSLDGLSWVLMVKSIQLQEKLYAKISTDPGEYLDGVLVSGFVTD